MSDIRLLAWLLSIAFAFSAGVFFGAGLTWFRDSFPDKEHPKCEPSGRSDTGSR